jgi:hypothetical protein
MSGNATDTAGATVPSLAEVHGEVERWFFEDYLTRWVQAAAADLDPRGVLSYWGVPMHAASVYGARWLTSDDDVLRLLEANHKPLRAAGYSNTQVLDRHVTVYNPAAAGVDVIWSRRREDQSEIERLAVHFEIRRTASSWIVIALASSRTTSERLADAWFSVD